MLAADELDLFSFLDSTPADLTQIAAHVELPLRSVEALLAVLAASGYLVKHAEQFHLTALARTYLLQQQRLLLGADAARRGRLAARRPELSSGGCEPRTSRPTTASAVRWEHGGITPEDAERSNRNFHSHSFPAALGLARAVDLSDVRRMLDVAGGAGSFSIALALRYPNLRCTVADLPNVVANTRTYIERYQCQDRVDTHAFNMFEDAWPSGYDAIFFSNIFHDWDAHRRTDLANLAFAALPAGGRILIHEMLLNDAADGPLAAALFSVLMLGTRGKQFAYHELEELVTTAGFVDVRVTHTYGYYSLVSATKRG